jgi:predicted DNA-binding transcriptional regulator AlpA
VKPKNKQNWLGTGKTSTNREGVSNGVLLLFLRSKMELDIKELAKQIAKEIKPQTAFLVDLHGIEDMLSLGFNSSVASKLVKEPGFPSPIKVGDCNKRFWRRADVEAYFNAQVERQSQMALKVNHAAQSA